MVCVDLIIENNTDFPIVELEAISFETLDTIESQSHWQLRQKGFNWVGQRNAPPCMRCTAKAQDQGEVRFRPEKGLMGVEKVRPTM